MKEVELLKNRKGLMEDDDFAQAVIEQVRLELAEDPDQAEEFSDWWSLSVEIQGRVVDINAYSGIYATDEGLHFTIYATIESGDGTISTDVGTILGRADVTSEEDTFELCEAYNCYLQEDGSGSFEEVQKRLDELLIELDNYAFIDITEEAKSKIDKNKVQLSAFMNATYKKKK